MQFYPVELSMMRLYSLAINGEPLVEVEVETPAWLPVRPRLDKKWLHALVLQVLRRYFKRS